MEWDQYIFKKAAQFVSFVARPKADPVLVANTAHLAALQPRLTTLARLLSGRAVTVNTSEDVGGWKGDQFYLPASYHHTNNILDNTDFYIYRVFYMYGQFCLRHCWHDESPHTPEESLSMSEQNAQAVVDFLLGEFPLFGELYQKVLQNESLRPPPKTGRRHSPAYSPTAYLYGKWYSLSRQELALLDELSAPVDRNTVADDKDSSKYTELDSPAKENTEVLKVDTQKQEEYTLTHNFEKIDTLEEFTGRWRDFDGTDDLQEHSQAMQELNLRHLVRVDKPVHSVYRTDFVNSLGLVDGQIKGGQDFHLCYDEWDQGANAYKRGYCLVYPGLTKAKVPRYARQMLQKNHASYVTMKKHAERFLTESYVKKRVAWGEEPNLDAVVEAANDIMCGMTPSENVYDSARKKQKDVAVLVLTDTSLSTDGYTDNAHILDMEKQALVLAGQVWDYFDLQFQFDTFYSRTHNQCFYNTVKAFHQSWDDCQDKIGAIESGGYTRIGPAIRHAAYILQNVRADTKWLLLLTDGKPNDYDRYEGRYGIQDVRKAIGEARACNIHMSALAIDAKARYYLPQMFGSGSFEILKSPALLPFALLNSYLKIIR